MLQKMFLKAEAEALETAPHGREPQQGPNMKKKLHFQVLLIVLIGSGRLLNCDSLATIAVLETVGGPQNPTKYICAIESKEDQSLSCWNSAELSVLTPQEGSWVGIVAGGTFMCGLQYPNRNAVCWTFTSDVHQFSVPDKLKSVGYKDIAAGGDHVCAIRNNTDNLDCWNTQGILENFVPQHLYSFRLVTAGNGWTCTVSLSYTITFSLDDLNKRTGILCWTGDSNSKVEAIRTVEDVKNITFNLISAGNRHVCALYDGIDVISGMPVTSSIMCWSLGTEDYDFPDRRHSYNGLVSGPNYSCSMAYSTGSMECWGPGQPQLTGLEDVRFSESGIAASGSTICGVGLNDRFALRSICNNAIPRPFVFFLPAICSRTCLRELPYHFAHDSAPLDVAFDQQIQIVKQNFCLDRTAYLCVPCYNRPCESRCKELPVTSMVSCVRRSKPSCQPRGVVAIALSAVFAVLALLLCLWVFKASLESEKEGRRIGLFTKLTNVEHFCQHQAMFSMNLIEFSYKDLELATNGFHCTNLLGQGSSGCVFKGVLLDKRQVAVKKLSNNGAHNQSDIYSHFDGELKLLARLRHKNLVNLVGYCHQRSYWRVCCWSWPRLRTSARIDYRLLVFEYMPNGTLHSHLHHRRDHLDRPFLDWDMRLCIAVQAARGINFLHSGDPPIIHRDIKSSNILLDERWNARLSDLGISRLGPQGNRTHISTLPAGTLGYLDPEYYRSQHLTLKSDVYGFGVVLLEVLTGCKAIEENLDPANIVERCVPIIRSGQAQSILDPKLSLPSYVDKLLHVADIAESCVRMVQQERPTIAEVLYRLEVAAAAVAALDLTPELDSTSVG